MVTGVICEYNPFHKGHEAMLASLRAQGAEVIVCAMSGNFVQRGDAAILDKFARAETAARCGADLVLELPTVWAAATAETFARGGVQLLALAGCDHLAFGSECGDLDALRVAAAAVSGPDFERTLREKLDAGLPYAAARQAAAEERGAAPGLLARPNDILAVEYLKAIRQLKVDIIPIAVPRIGAAHNGGAAGDVASASHIRALFINEDDAAFSYMPAPAGDMVFREHMNGGFPVDINNAERAILDRLRRMDEEELAPYDGGGEGLYHRLHRAVRSADSLRTLLAALETKRYPTARLRRMVLRAWLGVEAPPPDVPYLRVLAATAAGRRHLRRLQDMAAPVLTKPADVALLGPEAAALFAQETRCTDLYQLCRPVVGRPGADWRETPRMV